jgi:hypothetical protein
MKLVTKNRKAVRKAVRKVCFWQVKVNTKFKYEGETYLKFRPKNGMSSTGKLVTLADCVMVEQAN